MRTENFILMMQINALGVYDDYNQSEEKKEDKLIKIDPQKKSSMQK